MGKVAEGYDIQWKPQTKYGYRFKSSLEVLWADAFVLSEPREVKTWQYEKHKFDIGRFGKYTPDFCIFDAIPQDNEEDFWIVEIKPRPPLFHECVKTYALQQVLKVPVLIYVGPPEHDIAHPFPTKNNGEIDYRRIFDAGGYRVENWDDSLRPWLHRVREVPGMDPKAIF